MLSAADRERYASARDKVDTLIREHSEDIQNQLKILAKIRTLKAIEWIEKWRAKNISKISGFDAFIDYGPLEQSIGLAYSDYFRYVFYYRMANQMKDNIEFRKVISFEFYYFSRRDVLNLVENTSQKQTRHMDADLFYLSPLAHFFHYRIQSEFYNRRGAAIQPLVQDNKRALVQVEEECIANMTQFIRGLDQAKPGLFAFRDFIRSGGIRLESVVNSIETAPEPKD